MATNVKKPHNLDSLDKEIRVLRQKARQLEGRIDDNFIYFQNHSGSLFMRSLLLVASQEQSMLALIRRRYCPFGCLRLAIR